MMPVRYCGSCWADNTWDATACARCGAPLAAAGLSYRDKLVAALAHPEPETRARAATILGQVASPDDAEVVTALLRIVESRPQADAALQEAAARSLGQLGAQEAIQPLRTLARRSGVALTVRLGAIAGLAQLAHTLPAARDALASLAGRETEPAAIQRSAAAALVALDNRRERPDG